MVPHRVCARDAGGYLRGDPATVEPLAAQVARWVDERPPASTFATGSRRFDGEWRFGTYVMAALGSGQRARVEEGEPRRLDLARMERCLDALLEPDVRAYDTEAWGEDALATLDGDHGHLAFLAYAGLPFALHAELAPSSPHAARAHAIATALARRFEASPNGIVETYPGEAYPPDMAVAAAAIALDARSRGANAPALLARGGARAVATVRSAIDPASGLLVQSVDVSSGRARDVPRASGTALASYAMLHADRALSASLWRALRTEQFRTLLGFGAMLEYGDASGRGDIDSGPVLLGLGVSATGFALAASRAHGDTEAFEALYATTHLFGAPFDEGGFRTYTTGGPLGDAILFAMTTAPKEGS